MITAFESISRGSLALHSYVGIARQVHPLVRLRDALPGRLHHSEDAVAVDLRLGNDTLAMLVRNLDWRRHRDSAVPDRRLEGPPGVRDFYADGVDAHPMSRREGPRGLRVEPRQRILLGRLSGQLWLRGSRENEGQVAAADDLRAADRGSEAEGHLCHMRHAQPGLEPEPAGQGVSTVQLKVVKLGHHVVQRGGGGRRFCRNIGDRCQGAGTPRPERRHPPRWASRQCRR
eukprot:scaffold4081_cov268-Pinguiococcus_pyrenoidosus.AAC.1